MLQCQLIDNLGHMWFQEGSFVFMSVVIVIVVACVGRQELNNLHPDEGFRLWMTAEVHPKFPTVLLQSSLKITYEVCGSVLLLLQLRCVEDHSTLIIIIMLSITMQQRLLPSLDYCSPFISLV